jgi:hypothetical protein
MSESDLKVYVQPKASVDYMGAKAKLEVTSDEDVYMDGDAKIPPSTGSVPPLYVAGAF